MARSGQRLSRTEKRESPMQHLALEEAERRLLAYHTALNHSPKQLAHYGLTSGISPASSPPPGGRRPSRR